MVLEISGVGGLRAVKSLNFGSVLSRANPTMKNEVRGRVGKKKIYNEEKKRRITKK